MVFPKKLIWNTIFLVLSGKTIFLFPENIILFFRRKMKSDLSQKNTWKYDIFFKCPEKMVFPKKIAVEYNLSYIIWKDGFFLQKIWYFFVERKMKDDLSQEVHGNMILSVCMYKCQKYDCTFLQKKSKMIFPRKNWNSRSYSRKSSNDFLYFHGDVSTNYFQVKKKQEI